MNQCDTAAWDVARPSLPARVAGTAMAGFRGHTGPASLPVIPRSAVTVVLELGDCSLLVDDASRTQRGSLVAGLEPGGVRIRGHNVECVEVLLSPVVAHTVLGASPAELGGVIAVEDLWGTDASRVVAQLGDTRSWEQRFALTDAFLVKRLHSGPAMDREVVWAWNRIVSGRGAVRVDDLADEIGWSRKRLWSRFSAQIGVPPKRAARLVRFDHAVRRLAAGHGPASVAAECGYVDQSHLHREVLAYTRMTPATLAGSPGLVVDDRAYGAAGTFVQDGSEAGRSEWRHAPSRPPSHRQGSRAVRLS